MKITITGTFIPRSTGDFHHGPHGVVAALLELGIDGIEIDTEEEED